ncbi:MAG: hypothetical protein GC172_04340 [Phycisphaera sp.]|nr:hypothetical protein [Phycisphaera sp.]
MRLDQWIQHLTGLSRMAAEDAPRLPPDRTLLSGERGEQLLWRACAGEATPWRERVLREVEPVRAPLLQPDAYLAIEVWAECELSALHALHRLARGPEGDGGLRARPEARPEPRLETRLEARLEGAILWHLEHTQPDNSTNRPWALHAFLLLAEARGPDDGLAREAALYAETLLHNMVATDARDEPLSRWILADAARELARFRAPPSPQSPD